MIFRDYDCQVDRNANKKENDAIRVDMIESQATYYSQYDLEHLGLRNNSASSVMIPAGY